MTDWRIDTTGSIRDGFAFQSEYQPPSTEMSEPTPSMAVWAIDESGVIRDGMPFKIKDLPPTPFFSMPVPTGFWAIDESGVIRDGMPTLFKDEPPPTEMSYPRPVNWLGVFPPVFGDRQIAFKTVCQGRTAISTHFQGHDLYNGY
jgi:hypothetical protein